MTNKERYEYRKANGLCVDCGKPTNSGKVRCAICEEKASIAWEAYEKEHKEERNRKKREKYRYRVEHGLCGECGKPNNNGKAKCDSCLQKLNRTNKERKDYLKSIGRCPQCGAEVAPGWVYCPICRLKDVERRENEDEETKEHRKEGRRNSDAIRRERYGEEGRCKKCGRKKEDDGFATCAFCRASSRMQYAKSHVSSVKRELGICLWCDKPAVNGYCYCEEHLKQHRENIAHARKFSKRDLVRAYLDVDAMERKKKKGEKQ